MSGSPSTSAPGPRAAHRPAAATQPPLTAALGRARQALLSRQRPDGHWVGELQGDTILESEYVLLMAFLGRERDEKVRKAARYLLQQQQPGGGWSIYPGGPAEVSASVKAYFALKLAGHDPDSEPLRKARAVIRGLGGAARCNSFTKFYLAFLGQIPYSHCPAVPPEMMFLPRWAYFNIYAMSSWTRTIVIPLTIFYAHKPVRRLPPGRGIAELFLEPPREADWVQPPSGRWLSWSNFFLAVDRLLKWGDAGLEPRSLSAGEPAGRSPAFVLRPFAALLRALRGEAVRRAEVWMLEHFADSDGLGAIFPPMVYTVIALRCLGYRDDSREMRYALKQLDDLMIEEDGAIRLQPCVSPVWDTALTLNALADAGLAEPDEAVKRGVSWLLEREVRRPGDWSLMNPGVEPGGWVFEYRNGFYPDTDDTAMVLMALAKVGGEVSTPARERGLRWLLNLQNRDGGWAAFDRDIDRQVLTQVPFADHNAMLDPSCPDITARVLEALGYFGFRPGHPQVDRALAFLEKTQEPEGCWIGRWGVNYLYGTWQVLQGLRNVGYDMTRPLAGRAVAWLKQVQQAGGGWGETCGSYDDPSLKGRGTPTASQTAWALLGLIAAGEHDSPEARAGLDWLARTQRPDGTWHEDEFTGTGFPKVFYLKYHLYALYFPLMALARAEAARAGRATFHGYFTEPAPVGQAS